MNRETARFIQSRFGELRISEARYEDLLSEADEQYPRYLNFLRYQYRIYVWGKWLWVLGFMYLMNSNP